jgi:hypothetical protein
VRIHFGFVVLPKSPPCSHPSDTASVPHRLCSVDWQSSTHATILELAAHFVLAAIETQADVDHESQRIDRADPAHCAEHNFPQHAASEQTVPVRW